MHITEQNTELDAIDMVILRALQEDAKLPQARIAKRVGKSIGAVNERIRKLVQSGVIKGFAALLDPCRLGLDLVAFIEVSLEHPGHEREFVRLMQDLAAVQECHYVTGESSCLLKVRARNREELRNLVLGRINSLGGVRQTRTTIVLETAKETPLLPLEKEEENRQS